MHGTARPRGGCEAPARRLKDAAQGGNGTGSGPRFAADTYTLSDAENDIRNPVEQLRIDSAHSPPIDASPVIAAPSEHPRRTATQVGYFLVPQPGTESWSVGLQADGLTIPGFGNFNYGATGKAAGLPEGLLLRSVSTDASRNLTTRLGNPRVPVLWGQRFVR